MSSVDRVRGSQVDFGKTSRVNKAQGATGPAGKAAASSGASSASQSGDILSLSAATASATTNVGLFEGSIADTPATQALTNVVSVLPQTTRQATVIDRLSQELVNSFLA